MKKINLFIAALFFTVAASAQATSNFDSLTLGVDTFWNGSDFSGGFANGNAYFENQYDTTGGYDLWSGFIYSDKTDSVTPGYLNPASAITAAGFGGSKNYAIGNDGSTGNLRVKLTGNAAGKTVEGFYVTNTTYAYLSMLNGDAFENAFSATNLDYFLLTITGWKNGQPINDTVDFYLADFLNADTTQNYIVKDWQWVSLLKLGNVDSLVFSMYSSQNYIDSVDSVTGMHNDSINYIYPNTPTYFAMDNFVTSDLSAIYDTILYNQDTLLNVLAGVVDTAGGPFTVQFVRNLVSGASVAVVDTPAKLWYIPQDGIVGDDMVTYTICNSSNVCDTGVAFIDLRSPTGIKQVSSLETRVYPNPCGNSFSIYHTADVKTVSLYDLEGRLIRTIPCNAGELVTGVATADLEAGTYIVKVISDQSTGVAKVIKQ